LLIVGLGGTTRDGSSSEVALRIALEVPREHGFEVSCLTAKDLTFPHFDPSELDPPSAVRPFLDQLRRTRGVIISSPCYHGGMPGLLKNAIDHLEYLAHDEPPYLEGRGVGCISVATGNEPGASTLRHMRDVVHSLRGWPTPYGVALDSSDARQIGTGAISAEAQASLRRVGQQVVDFAYTTT
jgi:FMN reductase